MVNIHRKVSKDKYKNYRGIVLLITASKIHAKVLKTD